MSETSRKIEERERERDSFNRIIGFVFICTDFEKIEQQPNHFDSVDASVRKFIAPFFANDNLCLNVNFKCID